MMLSEIFMGRWQVLKFRGAIFLKKSGRQCAAFSAGREEHHGKCSQNVVPFEESLVLFFTRRGKGIERRYVVFLSYVRGGERMGDRQVGPASGKIGGNGRLEPADEAVGRSRQLPKRYACSGGGADHRATEQNRWKKRVAPNEGRLFCCCSAGD